jgi:hypothetical protein
LTTLNLRLSGGRPNSRAGDSCPMLARAPATSCEKVGSSEGPSSSLGVSLDGDSGMVYAGCRTWREPIPNPRGACSADTSSSRIGGRGFSAGAGADTVADVVAEPPLSVDRIIGVTDLRPSVFAVSEGESIVDLGERVEGDTGDTDETVPKTSMDGGGSLRRTASVCMVYAEATCGIFGVSGATGGLGNARAWVAAGYGISGWRRRHLPIAKVPSSGPNHQTYGQTLLLLYSAWSGTVSVTPSQLPPRARAPDPTNPSTHLEAIFRPLPAPLLRDRLHARPNTDPRPHLGLSGGTRTSRSSPTLL